MPGGGKMETIKFDCKANNAPAYSCNKPGDNSGEYVGAELAFAMRDLIIDLQATLRAINPKPMLEQSEERRKVLGI